MADGDDAVLAGMEKVNGAIDPANTIDDLINRTRDYIARGMGAVAAAIANKVVKRDAAGRAQFTTPSAAADAATKGYVDAVGTDAATASAVVKRDAAGRAKFATPSAASDAATKGYVDGAVSAAGTALNEPDTVMRRTADGRAKAASPTFSDDVANKSYVDGAVGGIDLSSRVAKSGDTMSGHLFLPASSAATSSYTVAYINGDGRVSRGASTERVKEFITDTDPLGLGNLFPVFKRWQMREGDGVWRYGYTAEQLAADPVTEPFVIYERDVQVDEDGNVTGAPHLKRDAAGAPIPESIDFIGLLLAQNAQLNARLAALEANRKEDTDHD